METVILKSAKLVQSQALGFERSLAQKIDWSDRLIGIVGARGTGKTTLLLQQLKHKGLPPQEAAYASLDDLYFTENSLVSFGESFLQLGGRFLYLDEVHKYPDWAREVKNLYDTYPELRVVFSGSSIIDILSQQVDLSRRAVMYELAGFSYREYLAFTGIYTTNSLTLSELVKNHTAIATEMVTHFKPMKYFGDYLQTGYYPFFAENLQTYPLKLEQLVKMILESDLQYIEGFNPGYTRKMLQLMYVLAANVPFKPNLSKLAEKIGLHRNTLAQYLHYLEKARLINTLSAGGRSTSTLQKPDKIFLENTNLQVLLAPAGANRGTQRETFLLNQLRNAGHGVTLPPEGEFWVDETYTLEVGGKDKGMRQISKAAGPLVLADDLEVGLLSKIPLWLMGFLY